MSTDAAFNIIETVRKKLEKYVLLKQDDKVLEYLKKLQQTSIDDALMKKTKIDELVYKLSISKNHIYSSTAQDLLKKWTEKKSSTKISNAKMITKNETKLMTKRKSIYDDDDKINSSSSRKSQSHNRESLTDHNQSSSMNKKRKVLSLSEYLGSKKPTITSSSTNDIRENTLTDSQIKEIYDQFDAKGRQLVASAPDLATNVNRILERGNQISISRHSTMSNDFVTETKLQTRNHLWEEEEDEDEDDDDNDDDDKDNYFSHSHSLLQPPQPIKDSRTVNKTDDKIINIQKQSKQISTNDAKPALAPTVNVSLSGPQKPLPPKRPQQNFAQKKPETNNFLRSRTERQAIYSGKRIVRTFIPSLQDLCVETLKENVDHVCHSHFNRLPYDVVKPILDVATPEQLNNIIDNNPDYTDDVEPLWNHFCSLHFKDAEREVNESYFELYWRKINEREDRLLQIREQARRKKDETVVTARQTKSIYTTNSTRQQTAASKGKSRQVVGLPPMRNARGQTKIKKPPVAPLLKKALQLRNGKF